MKTRHFVTEISLAIALLSIPRFTTAQQTGAAPGVPIQLVVSVEPKHGNEIPMITQQDVLVYQGHDRRPVTGGGPCNRKPRRAGLGNSH